MKWATLLLTVLYFGCSSSQQGENRVSINATFIDTLALPNKLFSIKNGSAYYNGSLFSGITIEHNGSGSIKLLTTYLNGLEHGFTKAFYAMAQPEYERFYTRGEKDKLHKGWWPNGNKRFEYHFSNGVYHGAFKEWYEDGRLAKNIRYNNGNETEGKGWRNNGKVYMSFVVKNGRRYGLVNAQLCYSLKNERGEYVENVK